MCNSATRWGRSRVPQPTFYNSSESYYAWKPRKQRVIFQTNQSPNHFFFEWRTYLFVFLKIKFTCLAWKTFKDVNLPLMLGTRTGCIVILWKHSLWCLFLPDVQKKYMLMCTNHTSDFPKWWLEMDLSLRHFQLCPGFSAMSRCRRTRLPGKEHGMSCSIYSTGNSSWNTLH